MDAMIRDRRLGSARTTTQLRATVVVHRPVFPDRGDALGATASRGALLAGGRTPARAVARAGVLGGGAAGRVDLRAGALATTTDSAREAGSGSATVPADWTDVIESRATAASIGDAALFGATTLVGTSRTVGSLAVVSMIAATGFVSAVFALASVCSARAESTDSGVESGLRRLSSVEVRAAVAGFSSCTIHAPQAIATNATMPAPFHTFALMGARCGAVPHHLHEPMLAG